MAILPHSMPRSLPGNVDLKMFDSAQAYVKCLRDNRPPCQEEIDAWNWLSKTYRPVLRSFVMRYYLDPADADDCLQEAWLDIFEKLAAFESDGNQARLCCWLSAIVRSKAGNLRRYRMRHPAKTLDARLGAILSTGDSDPAAECERDSLREAVQRTLDLLHNQVSSLSYRAFKMRHIEERSLSEITSELGITPEQAWCLLHRAKRSFRRLFERIFRKTLFPMA